MYMQPARHPRAGIAIGIAILVLWMSAMTLAFATGEPTAGTRSQPSPTPAHAPATGAR
jgi:hypothetical protein